MQITTITFFKYKGLVHKAWAFGMMQFAHAGLSKVDGLSFYKLMGSGKGMGFNPLPDWSTYALLQVWDSEASADVFFEQSELMNKYRTRTSNIWTLYLKNIIARGEWSGSNPFQASTDLDSSDPQLAVITRASIKFSKLRKFWSYVPTSHSKLQENKGLIFTKGIGEIPIIQMATFSLWKNAAALKAFAYKGAEHRKAIEMTRELDWYDEELFARFQVIKQVGSDWNTETTHGY